MGLLHAGLVNTVPDVELVAFCDRSRIISRFVGKAVPGVRFVTNVDDLKGFNVDTVYITAPTSAHYNIIKTLFGGGICRNVFVEKPLTGNARLSRELCDIARQAKGAVNMVGYNRRFNVAFRKAQELLAAGDMGRPLRFEVHAFSSDFAGNPQAGRTASRGGVLRDMACHAIDLAIWLMGDISFHSVESGAMSVGGVLDSTSFNVSVATGVTGKINASWCEARFRLPEIGFRAEFENGRVLAVNDDKLELSGGDGQSKVWHKQDLNDNTAFMLGGTDYSREDAMYLDAVKTGKSIEPGFETALKVDEIIEQVETGLREKSRDG